ncbi:hypothetical protein GWK47_028579 [Chionoecetes opilio]|uniref:Uncharacterized protein n=1 Tax=Chionoecetes opilio TaxID=41210 RepID=A0A8J4YL06_CHIOP|nr:hypothetical protein GWK47_028579 [Chionoecetes opilio]
MPRVCTGISIKATSPYSLDQGIHLPESLLIRQQKKQSTKIRKQLEEHEVLVFDKGLCHDYYLTADNRAAALRQLRETILVNGSDTSHAKHPDLSTSRIKRDESGVTAICDLLEMTGPIHSPMIRHVFSVYLPERLRGRTFLMTYSTPCKRGKRRIKASRNVLKREQAFMTQ